MEPRLVSLRLALPIWSDRLTSIKWVWVCLAIANSRASHSFTYRELGSPAQAAAAGGKILKPAQDTDWGGYSGYFADLDSFLWEVAWNPHFDLTAKSSGETFS